ncbi:hypothetical protein J2S78_000127 [Salibacterium salarium]|uniref:DUF4326 domain-containing protein n=1 Tax=Salibacterium salarium TaxID=284579 RepID=UPI00278727BD|nr:DUF4326 domain-containing protein [Salibacterium salarium]MDQ0297719.1 hypothetical protein [Salibacterium salarium]
MAKTTVVNKKHEAFNVYIGRGSKWGNPFSHLDHTKAAYKIESREASIEAYKNWLMNQPDLLDSLHELQGQTLGCFCKPHPCHGDILAELADAGVKPKTPSTTLHIGFTGHWSTKLGGYNLHHPGYTALQRDLEAYIERNLRSGYNIVGHSGLALDGDTIWSKAILAMKTKHSDRVQFHAEIPMNEQPSAWVTKTISIFGTNRLNRPTRQPSTALWKT